MAYLKSSQITGLSAKDVDVKGFTQAASINLGDRLYSEHEVLLADAYNITGDVTISDNLILAKLSDDGNAITLTGNASTTRTISGSGSLEGSTFAQTPNASLTGMTGVVGSAVTGSPALNLGNTTGTLESGVTGGSGLDAVSPANLASGVLPVGVTGGSGLTALGTVASGTIGSGVTGGSGLGANEPAFHANGDGSTQTLCPNGTYQLINFPTVTLDTGGFYVTATDKFLPTDGVGRYYHITAHLRLETTTTFDPMWLNLYKNGSAITRTQHQMNEHTSYDINIVTWLDGVDDYLQVYFYQAGGANRNCHAGSGDIYFGGFALSLE